MIPNEIIDQILDKTDIVEIISGYVPIKKSGQNFKGRCPFHNEKTPSFMVSPAKQIFHCFGCGAGGNAISFLMKYDKMDFIDAIKMLADKTNVALPQSTRDEKGKNSFADKLFAINNTALDFYQANLTNENGKGAYRYFIQRGIAEKTIKHFRLGFAPDSWRELIGYCGAKNIPTDIMEKAGLVVRKENTDNCYDRFRNRIIFPIFDLRNRVLGFGARALDDSLPKYINSPETYVYSKGKQLYGLNLSKNHIRKQNYVIIVEGYFDLIMPFQNEICNIVATLGTALTKDQISILKRFTKNAIIVYDSDKAGEAATLRGLDLLIEEDMNVRIAVLPKGSDPDSFIRREKIDAFTRALKSSQDLFDYKLGTLTAKFKKEEPRGKARIVSEMLPTLARIKNDVLKSAYLKKIAEELSTDEGSIRSELKKLKSAPLKTYRAPMENTGKKPHASVVEITILAIVLEVPRYVDRIKKELGFESFKDKTIAAILEKISSLHIEGTKIVPSHLIGFFEGDRAEEIISEATSLNQTISDKNKVLEDCFKYIKKNDLKAVLSGIQFKIKEAEGSADRDRVNALMAEYNQLIKGVSR